MGLFGDILGTSGIGSVIAPIAGFLGQQSTNSANQAIATQNNQFNAQQQQAQNDWQQQQNSVAQSFSAEQAQKQMDFQQSSLNQQENFASSQSATQYQRAVADLKAAGLNPMLASMNGGNSAASMSTASGASGQGFAGSSKGASSSGNPQIGNSIAAAMQGLSSAADISLKKAATDKTNAETANVDTNTDLQKTQILINAKIPDKLAAEIVKLKTDNDVAKGLITLNKAHENGIITAAQLDQARIYLTNNQSSTETAKQNLLYDQTFGQQQENKIRKPYADNPNYFAGSKEAQSWIGTAAGAAGASRGMRFNPNYSNSNVTSD